VNDVTLFNSYVTLQQLNKPNFDEHLKYTTMSLLTVLLVLIIAGLLLYLVNNYIPMDHKIKNIFNIVVVIAIIIWLLKVFGIFSYLKNVSL